MAADYIAVQPDSTGKKVDTVSLTSTASGTPTVERQVTAIGDGQTFGNLLDITVGGAARVDRPALATYAAGGVVVPVTGATDLLVLKGSGTKIIRVTRFYLGGTASTAVHVPVLLHRRSAANSGGTSSAPAGNALDSTDGAATGVLTLYTANATSLGADAGVIGGGRIFLATTTTLGMPFEEEYERFAKRPVLNSAAEYFCVNLNGTAISSGSMAWFIEWTEE